MSGAGAAIDPRVELVTGDVSRVIAAARATYDAILLDLYEGPNAQTQRADDPFYGAAALARSKAALRPGGVLAAVLYSGKVIGDAEKQAALAFFKALPLTRYTVLVCEFANWAQTAPLPCFVIKK